MEHTEARKTRMVVARYQERLEWLLDVPSSIEIVVVNKGERIDDPRIERRLSGILPRPNVGREADSYLAFVAAGGMVGVDQVVFTQGDPFSHSPDFLRLLEHADLWQTVQPLSVCWQVDRDIPPKPLLNRADLPAINGTPYRTEVFSLATLAPILFWDPGVETIYREYLRVHGLSVGEAVIPHFLKVCGLEKLRSNAECALLGEFCYGGIFGLRPASVTSLSQQNAETLLNFSGQHGIHAYVFERIWLHLFGHPFLRSVAEASP